MAKPSRPFIAALVVLAFGASSCRLPKLDEAEANTPGLEQTSYLYAGQGKHAQLITALHDEQDREVVPLKKIPDDVRNAVIAIEDKRFYEHDGVDLRAVIRAGAEDAAAGTIVQGGSTITEQYVKNTLLTNEQTLSRKWNEAVLAYQMEQKYTKEEILQKYLNTVYFGEGAYGVQAAAQRYFSKDVGKLTLPQAAMLAGLIQSPNDYSPLGHKKKAVVRRNTVLFEMHDQGMLTDQQYDTAKHQGLHLKPAANKEDQYPAPYFVDYVKRWFLSNPKFGTYDERVHLLFSGGLNIYTTVDLKMQHAAEQAVSNVLSSASDPYGAMVAIDPTNGYVKAMVGGRDWWGNDKLARLNLATGGITGRPAGSAAKIFTLVGALEQGIKPSKTYNAPQCIDIKQAGAKPWHVCNAADGEAFGSISLTAATAGSVNTVFAQVIDQIGAEQWVKTALEMGLRCCEGSTNPDTPLLAVDSATLGSNPVNPVEMASAYGTLAFGGRHAKPTPVSKITYADGTVLYDAARDEPAPKQGVDPKIAATAEGILEGVITGGTGTAANIGRPEFGKTGTGQNYGDAWFAGAVPQLSTAVWVGYPEGQKSMCCTRIGPVFGGTWPAQIWHNFMLKATRGMPRENFPKGNVKYVNVEVDTTRNCLPNKYTPKGDIERVDYVQGQQPTKKCKQPTSFGVRTVPLVVGLSAQSATLELNHLGFAPHVVEKRAGKPYDVVVDQTPSAGTELSTSKPVTLVISEQNPKKPAKKNANG